jgi:hypothetical protein
VTHRVHIAAVWPKSNPQMRVTGIDAVAAVETRGGADDPAAQPDLP